MDEHDAVLAITAAVKNMQQVMNLAWDILLPAMQPEALEEDHAASKLLVEKSAQLRLSPVPWQTSSPRATEISGKSYIAEANASGIESFTLDFTDTVATFTAQTTQGEVCITAAFGRWCQGQVQAALVAVLFNEIWLDDALPLAASGAWVDENHYMMVVRLYTTPYVYTLHFQFEGDALTITVQINVSLETTEPQIIAAILRKS
jgi:hypothetical protein